MPTQSYTFNQLKDYIEKNGVVNVKGNKLIQLKNTKSDYVDRFSIIYLSDTNKIMFQYDSTSRTSSGVTCAINFEIGPKTTKTEISAVYQVYENSKFQFGVMQTASLILKEYQSSKDIDFSYITPTDTNLQAPEDQEYFNACLRLAFSVWDEMLLDTVGLQMKNLGFTSYKG